ncbi:RDD family protein [Evansella sp. AB-P1]|uniref:RDD family protein n=1 Tax=Evansella sp. AB-P1 TaxID=3037653 RepID=UPI00241E27F3|nr:RDD family protein [Evansella sp. AB-P1]MDG5787387.1 RDD family protein [Evansella sp. AB-P1]
MNKDNVDDRLRSFHKPEMDSEKKENIENYLKLKKLSRSPASIAMRFWAYIIDISILIGSGLIFDHIFTDNSIVDIHTSSALLPTYLMIVGNLYFAVLHTFWHGYTIGKRIVGIRVANMDKTKLKFFWMLLRSIILEIPFLMIISAYIASKREDIRGIHDLAVSTYVTNNTPEEDGLKNE